jgi:hypothetical protein
MEAAVDTAKIATETHYSPKQIAKMWGVSEDTVRRSFEDYPGVLKFSARRLSGRGRHRVTLRIPESVLQQFHAERSRGFGGRR